MSPVQKDAGLTGSRHPDTQWPRYQVFVQEKVGEPHRDAGSVHAPDAELALLNARDVFVRRPDCISLWVAPATAIYSRTREELQEQGFETASQEPAGKQEFHVFVKRKPAGKMTYAETIEADSPQAALKEAVPRVSGQRVPFVWWVIPVERFIESRPEDIASMFTPAGEKSFRMPSDFKTLTAMRRLKDKEEE